jgi:tellurite methyltransferase
MRKAFWLFAILLTVSILLWTQQGKWDRYYYNKVSQPPREIASHVIERFSKPGVAIDLGAGVGNEAIYMVNHGWIVYALDNQPKAISILQSRKDDVSALVPLQADFSQPTTWNRLPEADLIFASYALPFVPKEEFKGIWNSLCGKLPSGGRFAGHFFGTQFQGFSSEETNRMTFLNRQEVLELFKDFEIEFFDESMQNDVSGTGKKTYSHVFKVIAIKK